MSNKSPKPARQCVPRATYRLQFGRGFTLRDARELVPYLGALGASHVYASPLLQARPGSPHGYDVCDPTRINPEIGSEADLEAFVAALRERGMGLVLDVVPNHLCVASGTNPWWQDVLRRGPASSYARHFDIDWNSPLPGLRGKVLLPILGDEYERVLECGELQLVLEGDIVTLRYFDHRLPLTTGSLPSLGSPAQAGLHAINTDRAVLDAIIRRQHYRLACWRRGDAELNYRRFFTITELAGVCVEHESVFADVHVRVRDWIERGLLDGLRVDHIDGLLDPAQYLERLRHLAPCAWILVEKILEPGEALPADWSVAGTTGYDFLHRVGGLFIDPAGEEPLSEFYREFTGIETDYAALVREKKRWILRHHLVAEVARLTRILEKVTRARAGSACWSSDELQEALVELVACFPVYRTYLRPDATASDSSRPGESDASATSREPSCRTRPTDLAYIEHALAEAQRGQPELAAAIDRLGELLLDATPAGDGAEFVARFQQLTGPAMAKGAEDTAFYCYNRLVALNEVGGDPGTFELSVDRFHHVNLAAQQQWPHSMLATTTHDTKRGEDVRARLAVLSELPRPWSAAVRRWSQLNEKHRRDGWPDRNAEYLFYQTLVGAWPLPPERALAYMNKAAREAKEHSDWNHPDGAYETALAEFITAALGDAAFLNDVEQFVRPIIECGYVNSLAQTLLKLTAPGVPDIYQGADLWDLSLVDPDNRRPVDFAQRQRLLEETQTLDALTAWARREEGLPKLWLIQRVLRVRREQPDLFNGDARYIPLASSGQRGAHVCAFARASEVRRLVVVVPRRVFQLSGGTGHLPVGPAVWGDTFLEIPDVRPDQRYRNLLTGDTLSTGQHSGVSQLSLKHILDPFPVAVLRSE